MKKLLKKSKKAGFTLIELSIVLVIIGLIVSSVLVGQELIKGAELNSVITQYSQFNSAVSTFRQTYGGIPGDVSSSSYSSAASTSDGDGVLEGSASTMHNNELLDFWEHLGSSGTALISGTYDGTDMGTGSPEGTLPKTKTGAYWGVFASSGTNLYIIGATTPSTANEYDTAVAFSPLDAKSLDTKIDNSYPKTGIIKANDASNAGVPLTVAVDTNGCTVDGGSNATDTYEVTNSSSACVLDIRMPF